MSISTQRSTGMNYVHIHTATTGRKYEYMYTADEVQRSTGMDYVHIHTAITGREYVHLHTTKYWYELCTHPHSEYW